MSALTDLFSALATKIRSKTGGSDTYTPPQMVSAIDDVYDAGVAAGTTPTQTKTVTAGTSNITVTPDAGYALSQVTVQPTPSESKSATPSTTAQTITPSTGKLLSSVTVEAVSLTGDAGTGDVLFGKTFYKDSLTKQTGTITSKAAQTYNTSTSNQTISSGQYLSGTQTIRAVTTSGIDAANIKDGAVVKVGDSGSATRIKNVTGTFTDAATVSSGQTAAAAAQIKSGYSAWVDGAEVKGTYTEPTYSGDATAADVKSGKTFYSNSSTKLTGTFEGQTKTATPTTRSSSAATVTPDTGKYLTSVIVNTNSVPKGTASLTRTTLWTNSTTTSSFSSQTVTLSQSMTNFDYLEVTWYGNTANGYSATTLIKVSDFVNITDGSLHAMWGLLGKNSSTATVGRFMTYVSNTSIKFANAVAGSTTGNSYLIPKNICGLKLSVS